MKMPDLSVFSKPWVLLVIALVLGGVATLMTIGYLKAKEDQVMAELRAKQGKTVQVVVPAYDLQKGTRISYDNMSVREIPVSILSALNITTDNFASYIGQELGYNVEAGAPLIRPMLRFSGLLNFADTVSESMRALTIRVDEINSISGMLRPGDRIDIFVKMADAEGEDVVFPLLYNTSIKATGQMVEGEESTTSAGSLAQPKRYNTVTLEVTPKDAQRLILAQAKGKITAVLRNAEDFLDVNLGQMRVDALLMGTPTASGDMEQPPSVRLLLGGVSTNGSTKVVNIPYIPRGAVLEMVDEIQDKMDAAGIKSGDANMGAFR